MVATEDHAYGDPSETGCIVDANGYHVARYGRHGLAVTEMESANARMIVAAVNSHARLVAENARLREALVKLKRNHMDYDGDVYHSCALAPEYALYDPNGICTCGASRTNNIIRSALEGGAS